MRSLLCCWSFQDKSTRRNARSFTWRVVKICISRTLPNEDCCEDPESEDKNPLHTIPHTHNQCSSSLFLSRKMSVSKKGANNSWLIVAAWSLFALTHSHRVLRTKKNDNCYHHSENNLVVIHFSTSLSHWQNSDREAEENALFAGTPKWLTWKCVVPCAHAVTNG